MALIEVRWLVEFGYEGAQVQARARAKIFRPVEHSIEKVDEPLARDIVADRDQPQLR